MRKGLVFGLAAAVFALACVSARAEVFMFQYAVKIDRILDRKTQNPDRWQWVDRAELPGGDSLSVGELGWGYFSYDTEGFEVGYASDPDRVSNTYMLRDAPTQRFAFDDHAFLSAYQPNRVSLTDSYNPASYADKVSFFVQYHYGPLNKPLQSLYIDFEDPSASTLPGTDPEDIGDFPLRFPGTFWYTYIEDGGYNARSVTAYGTITAVQVVSAVPEPSGVVLMLLGLLACTAFKLGKKVTSC
jgi:hypothetical protein